MQLSLAWLITLIHKDWFKSFRISHLNKKCYLILNWRVQYIIYGTWENVCRFWHKLFCCRCYRCVSGCGLCCFSLCSVGGLKASKSQWPAKITTMVQWTGEKTPHWNFFRRPQWKNFLLSTQSISLGKNPLGVSL